MNNSPIQSISLLLVIGFSLILIFILNNIFNWQNDVLINYMGGTVLFVWFFSLCVFSIKGFNNAIKNTYYGFLVVLGLFHLGIPLGSLINYSNEYYDNILSRWYYGNYTVMSYMAVYFFIVGYLTSSFIKLKNVTKEKKIGLDYTSIRLAYYLYIFIVVVWIILVKIIGGVSNYSQYALLHTNSSFFGSMFTYGNGLIGILYVLTSLDKRYSKKSFYILLIWAAFALPIGLRGEVLFPLIIGLSFLTKYEIIKLNFFKVTVVVSFLLTALSAIFVYRHGEAVENASISPFAAIVEMGGSLRPVSESIKWISNNEISFYLGATYWAPFERLITKFIPFIERLPASQDMRLMNVVIMEKSGPYGFSIIAEAFVNYSLLGCLLVGLISGCVLRYYDSLENKNSILVLAIVFAMFFHIRQSFVGAFGMLLLFLIVYMILCNISLMIKGKKT